MVFRRAHKHAITIPVPVDTDSWNDLLLLSSCAVSEVCPSEAEHFDDVAAEFRSDPVGLFKGRRLNVPVGAGIDLEIVTPYLLAFGSFVLAVVSQAVIQGFSDELSEGARSWIAASLRRLRRVNGDAEIAPPADSPAGNERPHSIMKVGLALDKRQEQEIVRFLVNRGSGLDLDEQRLLCLAEAFIGALKMSDGPE